MIIMNFNLINKIKVFVSYYQIKYISSVKQMKYLAFQKINFIKINFKNKVFKLK